jgi:hypothetical protein
MFWGVIMKKLRMVCLDLVSQQMQHFLVNAAGVLADMQKVTVIRRKTGNIGPVFKNAVLAFILILVRIFTYFKVVHLLILADRDRVIFHGDTTISKPVCLTYMEQDEELHSFPYDATIGGTEHHYRITKMSNITASSRIASDRDGSKQRR